MDINTVVRAAAVVGLTIIAGLLVWKGDNAAALTVAAMITPGAVQMPRAAANVSADVVGKGGALLLVVGLAVGVSACGGAHDVPSVADPRYGVGLSSCVADVALAKEAMRHTDAGIDKRALYDRYEACTHNVETVFGFDAGGH
jgi:hypothetical protein